MSIFADGLLMDKKLNSLESCKDEPFTIICNNCGSINFQVDYEQDILWCRDCQNTQNILGDGLKYEEEKERDNTDNA